MAIEILMPALSPTMSEGNLTKWFKKEGDKVKPGDIIAEIETDKATMEVESADVGILGRILVPNNTEAVRVNQLIAVLLEDGESIDAADAIIKKHHEDKPKDNLPKADINSNVTNIASVHINAPLKEVNSKILVSPLARRIAASDGIDLSRISGSGPRGRIVKADVVTAKLSNNIRNNQIGRNPIEAKTIPLSQMRKVIAKRLVESKQNIPHFYLTIDCVLDELIKLRQLINEKAGKKNNGEPEYKISVNDFIIKASAQALKAVPNANASWSDNGIVQYNNVDVSVAVAISDGLITPIIKNADQKSILHISNEMKELSSRAKQNALRPEEFQGGGFSISNLGMYNIKQFQAIVNPPQACILAVGVSEKRPIVIDNQIRISNVMSISISCDHRVIDGALAAQLLNEFKSYIENPALMFIDF